MRNIISIIKSIFIFNRAGEFKHIKNEPDYSHLTDKKKYRALYNEVGTVDANKEIVWREEWMKHFNPKENSTIVELGAHNGPNLIYYAKLGHSLDGIEISDTLIATFEKSKLIQPAEVQKRIFMYKGWIEEFTPKKLYDYVLCTEILEHVADPIAILKKARECVKEEGLVYISSPTMLWGNNTHVRGVSSDDLQMWLELAGLYPEWITEENERTFCYARKVGLYSQVKKCDLCDNLQFKHVKNIQANEWRPVKQYYSDHNEPNPFVLLPDEYELVSCENCGLVFVNPRIEDRVVNRFYDEYLSGKYNGYIHGYDSNFREKVFNNYINYIKQYVPSLFMESEKNFLDIGCASGAFLKVAGEQGFHSFGIEVSTIVGNIAKEYGTVYIGDVLEQLDKINTNFDLVTLIDSIEHFKSPKETLFRLSSKVKKGGILFIEAPNYYGRVDEMSRHFYLFSQDTIKKLLDSVGFEIIAIEESGLAYNPGDTEIINRFLRVISMKV